MFKKKLDFRFKIWYKHGGSLREKCVCGSSIPLKFIVIAVLRPKLYLESEVIIMQCALCNEYIDDNEFLFDEAFEIDGEYWHAECYAEYYGEELEEAV